MAVPSEDSDQQTTSSSTLTTTADLHENGGIDQSNDTVEAVLEPVASNKDPKHEVPEPESLPSGSNDVVSSESVGQPEMKKDEGSRTFTMRELLNGLKGDQSQFNNSGPDSASPQRFDVFFFFCGFLV